MAGDPREYRPKARSAGLDIEELNGEIVVYDRTSDHVHLLSASTAKIWRLCDGNRRTVDIVDELEGREASLIAVDSALSELEKVELLARSNEAEAGGAPVNLSRRSLLTHAAGASAFAAATIVTLQAPLAQNVLTATCLGVMDCFQICPSAVQTDTNQCTCTSTSDLQCVGQPGPNPKICQAVPGSDADFDTCGCPNPVSPPSNDFCP